VNYHIAMPADRSRIMSVRPKVSRLENQTVAGLNEADLCMEQSCAGTSRHDAMRFEL